MGAKELEMPLNKKGIFLWVLFLGVILMSGCQTAKGAAKGTACTVNSVAEGIAGTAYGAAQDSVTLWQAILKVDDWIKKNLW